MKPRNYTALNPLLKKSHVHTEKSENVDEIINNGIKEYLEYTINDLIESGIINEDGVGHFMNFPTASEAYITTNAFVEDIEKQKALETEKHWKESLKIIEKDLKQYVDNNLSKALHESFRKGNYDLAICISKSIDMVSMVDNFNHYNHCELDQDYTHDMIDEFVERLKNILESLGYDAIMLFQKSHNIDPKLKTNAYYYTINFSWNNQL